ncbi:hypothetical protein HDU76_002527 [Blyttiomyces sp. JEL0837]|nr:hypothetical protein HDU76_002527 [Blyttiomyces sp. JEL0837]
MFLAKMAIKAGIEAAAAASAAKELREESEIANTLHDLASNSKQILATTIGKPNLSINPTYIPTLSGKFLQQESNQIPGLRRHRDYS